jgi:exopolysaccharide production protein ExoQ
MSTNSFTGLQPFVLAQGRASHLSLAGVAGFFFAFRLFFVLLAVRLFHQDAQVGVAASLLLNYLLLLAALLSGMGEVGRPWREITQQPCFRWVAAYVLLSGLSLLWSVTASLAAAAAFWVAMFADTAIVTLQLRSHSASSVADALMRGYVWGASAIAVIAWLMPAQPDLRLGDEELLGPNQIGWLCALAFFFAQFLMRQKVPGPWKIHALLLALTLLRCLSKTTILAFLPAQMYILLSDRSISRKTQWRIAALALVVCIAFSGLISNYYEIYTTDGDQSGNLTGRIGIWAYILTDALDRPLFGHGFHSVWKVIPIFYGTFEARHAHNELLQQFYAYGAAGVALLIATYVSIFRAVRMLPRSPMRVLFAGLLLFVLIRGLADTEVFDLSWPLWLIVLFGSLVIESRPKEVAV